MTMTSQDPQYKCGYYEGRNAALLAVVKLGNFPSQEQIIRAIVGLPPTVAHFEIATPPDPPEQPL